LIVRGTKHKRLSPLRLAMASCTAWRTVTVGNLNRSQPKDRAFSANRIKVRQIRSFFRVMKIVQVGHGDEVLHAD